MRELARDGYQITTGHPSDTLVPLTEVIEVIERSTLLDQQRQQLLYRIGRISKPDNNGISNPTTFLSEIVSVLHLSSEELKDLAEQEIRAQILERISTLVGYFDASDERQKREDEAREDFVFTAKKETAQMSVDAVLDELFNTTFSRLSPQEQRLIVEGLLKRGMYFEEVSDLDQLPKPDSSEATIRDTESL